MIRVTDQLAKAAHAWPDLPAVSCALRTLSWAELNVRTRALATVLSDAGVQRGDRLAYLGFNSHIGVECYYAPALVGAAVVPINFRLSERELIDCIHDCRPRVLVVDEEHAPLARAIMAACPQVEQVLYAGTGTVPAGMVGYEAALSTAGAEPDFQALCGRDDDMLIMFYTGGTTGTPKGVMLTHTNMFTNAMAALTNWDIAENGAHFVTGPLFHTAGGSRVFGASLMGVHLVLMPRFDAVELMGLVAKHRVTLLQFVPTMMAMLLDHPQIGRFDMSSVKMMTYGAAPMPPALMKRALKVFPGVRFGQAFGMTEASPVLTVLNPDYHVLSGPKAGKLTSLGRPVSYADVRVVDENDVPLPAGQIGEIIARGPNIMKGYWQQPEVTAEAMRGGWYHTGDSGYFDKDGFLFLAGRIKDMVITGGENVYPVEVEEVMGTHPAVRDSAIIGTPDPKWGERVHAVIVLHPGACPTEEEIIAHCRTQLAHYKCPTLVSFRTEPLPLTKVNKVDKLALRAFYNNG
ncbi:class I adenylate-forming enzyme family protein [Thalassovita taeanensis]|uniref:3-methylmercaptopropionyl-CoA ligase n=1 Tax=Thalassovita taeanensis TaxID=657014 RepID=A0A1H9C3C2_9RHOB|nr:long-chain-fatty-acid--CoA ligase [Thalassovita taeanensis]SEP95461.1 Acyl-CoA synthetase (AMP-forming)/AMP-acid ligase II [Thalassovita taeanensis]